MDLPRRRRDTEPERGVDSDDSRSEKRRPMCNHDTWGTQRQDEMTAGTKIRTTPIGRLAFRGKIMKKKTETGGRGEGLRRKYDLAQLKGGVRGKYVAGYQPMAGSAIDFETVRKIGLALPGVEEGTVYGSPALKVRGELLACVPVHRSAEPGSLAVRVDLEDRAELLAADPEVYYVTEHYAGYSAVLVRLARVNADVLRDLLGMAYKFVTRSSAPRSSAGKRRKLRSGE